MSRVQNSSVVLAMARCSAVRSSGVKTASGATFSSRNAPPFLAVVGSNTRLSLYPPAPCYPDSMRTTLLLLAAALAWGQQQQQQVAADPVVLTVGAEKITKTQFDQIMEQVTSQ